MAKNVCLIVTQLILTEHSGARDGFTRAVELALEAVALHKQTVLYLDKGWNRCGKVGGLEMMLGKQVARDYEVKFRSFLHAGGQIWLSQSGLDQHIVVFGSVIPDRTPLVEGVIVVDDKTLLTFLTQDTAVLTF